MLRLLRRLDLVERLADLLRNFPYVGRENRRRFSEGFEITPCGADGAQATDKFHANALLHLLGSAQQDAANLAGAAHMGSAAGVQIEIADVDQAQLLAFS